MPTIYKVICGDPSLTEHFTSEVEAQAHIDENLIPSQCRYLEGIWARATPKYQALYTDFDHFVSCESYRFSVTPIEVHESHTETNQDPWT